MNPFTRFWQLHGRKECEVVIPYAEWADNLPTGYAYNKALDGIYNASGVQLEDASPYWTTVAIPYYPVSGSHLINQRFVGGIIEDGKDRICVQADDGLAFTDCFAVLMNDRYCHVESTDTSTPGVITYVLIDK